MDKKAVHRVATLMKLARYINTNPDKYITPEFQKNLIPTETEVAVAEQYLVANMLANVKKSDIELARELIAYRKRDTSGVS